MKEIKTRLKNELEKYKFKYDDLKKGLGVLHEGELELSSGECFKLEVRAMWAHYGTEDIIVRAYAYGSGVFSIYPHYAAFLISPDNQISTWQPEDSENG